MKLIASILSSALLAVPLLSSSAAAAAAPTRFLDESSWFLGLNETSGEGYSFRFSGLISGVTGDSDAVRVEWSQKGKALASGRCKIDRVDGKDQGWVDCRPGSIKMTATGDVTVKLFYVDDQTETESLIRTFKVPVAAFRSSDDTSPNYGILGDDLLAPAYAYHEDNPEPRFARQLVLSFWSSGDITGADRILRCTVDGTRLADFQGVTVRSPSQQTHSVSHLRNNKYETFTWMRDEVRAPTMHWGTRAEVEKDTNHKVDDKHVVALGDHAGAWSCDLRADGKVQRTFRFTVGGDGRVAAHPAADDAAMPRMLASVSMVDVALPKEAVDKRIRPQAIRAGHSFGLTWPKADAVQAVLKELPPASGLADPEKVKAKKRK